jgi:hypothetical protein
VGTYLDQNISCRLQIVPNASFNFRRTCRLFTTCDTTAVRPTLPLGQHSEVSEAPTLAIRVGLLCQNKRTKRFSKCLHFRALRKASLRWNATGAASTMCRKARMQFGLARRQTKLCRTSAQVMPHIAKAAGHTVATCQSVFADRRWNCSTVESAPNFTPDITTGKFLDM